MKGFCCSLVTSHFLFEQSKQKWLREWEIKGHFSGSAIGRPPWGGQSTGGLYTLHLREAERPQWHDSTAERHRDRQPRPGSNRSCHAFKQGSNGAIVIKEWVIRMGEKATSVDQSPKTRWDREDSVDIHRNRGLGNKKCVPTQPLAFELISSLILSYNTRKMGEGKLKLTKIKFSLLVEGTQWKEIKLS